MLKTKDILYPNVTITVNNFDESSAKTFRKEFNDALATGQPVIPVLIDSFGGGCYSLLSMISHIETSPVPVATIGTGKCMSAAAALLASGTPGYRFINPHAHVMIHGILYSASGKQSEIKSRTDHGDQLQSQIINIMNKKCNKKSNFFQEMIDKNKNADIFLTAKECKKHNIVDYIAEPFLETEVKVVHTFKWK